MDLYFTEYKTNKTIEKCWMTYFQLDYAAIVIYPLIFLR